jgi:hypothetical protein
MLDLQEARLAAGNGVSAIVQHKPGSSFGQFKDAGPWKAHT